MKDLRFLIVGGAKVSIGRRLHVKERDDLEDVVLDDVAQAAGRFVKRAAAT